jgi:hypothetical protein
MGKLNSHRDPESQLKIKKAIIEYYEKNNKLSVRELALKYSIDFKILAYYKNSKNYDIQINPINEIINEVKKPIKQKGGLNKTTKNDIVFDFFACEKVKSNNKSNYEDIPLITIDDLNLKSRKNKI